MILNQWSTFEMLRLRVIVKRLPSEEVRHVCRLCSYLVFDSLIEESIADLRRNSCHVVIIECRILIPLIVWVAVLQHHGWKVCYIVKHFAYVKPHHVNVIVFCGFHVSRVQHVDREHLAKKILDRRHHDIIERFEPPKVISHTHYVV